MSSAMSEANRRKGWWRNLVEYALDRDVSIAIEEQQYILRAEPLSAKAHYDLGVLHYSQGRVAEAIAEYRAAIECDPAFACAYRRLGEVFINAGEYERAGQCAVKAAELGDNALVEMFERYPAFREFVKRPEPPS
ncbi:MAG: tetratricopeptide repeat protein [Blastocatellia bacterium]